MNPATPMIYCGLVWRTRVRVAPEIVLSDEEREVLDELIRSKLASVRLALRARIVLLAAQGLQNKEIALALDVGASAISSLVCRASSVICRVVRRRARLTRRASSS